MHSNHLNHYASLPLSQMEGSSFRSQHMYLLIRLSSLVLVSKVNWDHAHCARSSSTEWGMHDIRPNTGQDVRVLSSQFGDL